jgi:radical SAM protein with 4Fe4S-binding SPASM domain
MSGKFRNRVKLAAAYFRRQSVLNGGPVEITIETTAKCNLYCPMCPRQDFDFGDADMDLGFYKMLISQIRDFVEFAWTYGIGEPTLHPNLFEMIRIARDSGIRTGISTNATLLDGRRSDLLLEARLDYLIFAFDGATKRTYETYRVGATFEKTRINILNFLSRKLARRSATYVVLQMVLLKENAQEIEQYRRLWSIPGVDEVRFKRDEIQVAGTKIPGIEFKSERQNPCHLLWRGPLYVRYDGSAYPCCYMYRDSPIGDLRRQSVMEVWNSEPMIRLREAHINGDLAAYPTCRNCQAPRPSKAAFYGSLALNSLFVRKAVPLIERLSRSNIVEAFEKS